MQRAEILLAAYNGEMYLSQQLNSLLQQTWPNWHLTVSDDGSTDTTPSILEHYASQHPEQITVLRHGKRFGNARDHFFYLMQQCQAPYMLFCDQDDVWNSDKVEITMQALLEAEEAYGADMPLLVFTDQTPTNAELVPLAPSLMRMQKQDASVIDYRRILLQNIVTGCAMGFNQALAKLSLQCADAQNIIMHDWWMAAVAARFGKIVYLDQSTMLYRQHGRNSIGAKDVRSISYFLQKISHPFKLRKIILQKKKQASSFHHAYAEKMTDEDHRFLVQYALSRSGLCFYLKHRSLFNGFFRFAGTVLLG